ncbi:MAG: hypothetical protein QM737_01210 [Ferruginibacter sp.]
MSPKSKFQVFLEDDFKITKKSLSDIKKRVYVVGKFNTSKSEVSEFLFSKKTSGDKRFNDVNGEVRIGDLNYPSFIKKIAPELSEIFSQKKTYSGEPLPYFILSPQSADKKVSSSYIIDNYNYFDVRASSNSDQPYYKLQEPSVNIKDFLDAETFNGKNELPGKEIYKQIRKNLESFCAFQSENFKLIQAFTTLLSRFAGRNNVPEGITEHSELPLNFLPVFIDFLYLEKPLDETFDEKLKLIDFSSHIVFKAAVTDENKEPFLKFLVKLFTVFKNYLYNPSSINNQALNGYNINNDLNPKGGLISEELRKKFVASMEAYNMLTQIIQSKVLLSMVLRWAISFFEKEIPQIKKIKDVDEKNAAIEDAILSGKFELLKPAEGLPEGYSTVELIEDFNRDFRSFLKYINNSKDPKNIERFNQFSQTIQFIAEAILADEQRRNTIQRMMSLPDDQREIMLKALQNLFTDVLIPRIFKTPGLTENDLIKKYKEYETELFFTSAMMNIDSSGNIDSIIEKEMSGGKEKTKESIAGALINIFVGVLMEPAVQQDVEKAINTLQDYQLLRKLIPGITNTNEKNILGIGSITAIGSGSSVIKPGETNIYGVRTKEILNELQIQTIEKRADITMYLEASKRFSVATPAIEGNKNKELKSGAEEDKKAESRDSSLSTTTSRGELVDALVKNNLGTAIQNYISADNELRIELKKEIEKTVNDSTIVYQKSLSKIFERYAGNQKLPAFKSKVEALTLVWLLLLNKEKLHLGELGSNLYDLLLDLIEKLDADEPNLQSFFALNSLTKYISKGIFSKEGTEGAGAGFKALLTVLDNQANDSLGNVVQFVSELKGIRYLIDFAGANVPDCEIIVINAYQQEFLDWINREDNNGHFFDPTGLANNNSMDPKFPGVVFMTDLAFAEDGWDSVQKEKETFLSKLNDTGLLNKNGHTRLIPPICIGTSAIDPKSPEIWYQQGNKLNSLAKDAVCPVIILGPSLPLNKPDDYLFPTVLSSGYVFCAHLLSNGLPQNLKLQGVRSKPNERFRNLGLGVAELNVGIQHFIGAGGELDKDYAFAGDYYLYLIALIASAAKTSNIKGVDWGTFYNFFHYDGGFNENYLTSDFINESMIYNKMTNWGLSDDLFQSLTGKDFENDNSIDEDDNKRTQKNLNVDEILQYKNTDKKKAQKLDQATWFNKVVNALDLK